MEAIVLEVPMETAKNWLEVPKIKRKKLAFQFQEIIDLEAKKERNKKFFKKLDEISDRAAERGLTEDILNEILRNE